MPRCQEPEQWLESRSRLHPRGPARPRRRRCTGRPARANVARPGGRRRSRAGRRSAAHCPRARRQCGVHRLRRKPSWDAASGHPAVPDQHVARLRRTGTVSRAPRSPRPPAWNHGPIRHGGFRVRPWSVGVQIEVFCRPGLLRDYYTRGPISRPHLQLAAVRGGHPGAPRETAADR